MPIKLLDQETDKKIRGIFETRLVHPVEIIFFSKQDGCHTCEETRLLLDELTSTSSKLHFTTYDLSENSKEAQRFHVEMAPVIIIAGRDGDELLDYGVQFVGIPSGYEFSSLVQDIIMVSKRDSGLSPAARQILSRVASPVDLKVFVTPT